MDASTRRKWVIALTVALAIGGLIAGARWRHKYRLAGWKSEAKKQGEILSLAELEKKYPNKEHSSNSAAALTTALFTVPKSPIVPSHLLLMDPLAPGRARVGWRQVEVPVALGYAQIFSNRVQRGSPGKTNSWDLLRDQMKLAEPGLAPIRQMLQRNPDRDLGWHYTNVLNPPWFIYPQKREAAQALALATINDLHRGDWAAAAGNAEAMAGLAKLHDREWSAVNQMIRAAIVGMGVAASWETVQAPLEAFQLRGLQEAWEAVDLIGGLVPAMEVERAQMSELYAQLNQPGGQGLRRQLFGGSATGGTPLADLLNTYVLTPTWAAVSTDADELVYLTAMQFNIEAARSLAANRTWLKAQPLVAEAQAEFSRRTHGMGGSRAMLSAQILGNYQKALQTLMRIETQRQMLITDIALKRHRLEHGQYPRALAELVPKYLAALPIDGMNGEPLHYRTNTDGTFTLYSVGNNGKDDGGDGYGRRADIWDGLDAVWPRPEIAPEPLADNTTDANEFIGFDVVAVTDIIAALAHQSGRTVAFAPEVKARLGDYKLVLYYDRTTAAAALAAMLKNFDLEIAGTNSANGTIRFRKAEAGAK